MHTPGHGARIWVSRETRLAEMALGHGIRSEGSSPAAVPAILQKQPMECRTAKGVLGLSNPGRNMKLVLQQKP